VPKHSACIGGALQPKGLHRQRQGPQSGVAAGTACHRANHTAAPYTAGVPTRKPSRKPPPARPPSPAATAAAAAPHAGPATSSLPLAQLLGHAADALQAVRAGRSLGDALVRTAPDARAGALALASLALRRLGSASFARAALAPRNPPPQVDALLLLALALLWPAADPPYADHTLVDQAVACARRRTPNAAGFVNAVLRRFVRERDALTVAAAHDPQAAWNHPAWWIDRVRRDWPDQWQALLRAAASHPPMTLRVNLRRTRGPAWLQRAADAGRPGRLLGDPRLGGQAVMLDQPCPVQALPGFDDGEVSVQDAAAQLAAPLLIGGGAVAGVPPLRAGARVLDACAAPGGKTAQLLECRPDLELLALDRDAQRLARIGETLQRLGLAGARLEAADAREPARWWDGRPFDAVLLDAPCTASGIVRRHPDIPWLRRPGDVDALARTQAALLDGLWPLVAPGGRLLYATCSIFRTEGQSQIDAFVQRQGPTGPRIDPASPGHWLPLADNGGDGDAGAVWHDGFFYALLHKAA
jgi:16S rRNA (cytosine967-C5)-methyltransferase